MPAAVVAADDDGDDEDESLDDDEDDVDARPGACFTRALRMLRVLSGRRDEDDIAVVGTTAVRGATHEVDMMP